jgi:prepilin-type N-terminal cleavage/methylation domain-containing protein
MKIPKRIPEGGFTLSEIIIALGIFAIAVSGLMALFPVAQKTEREATQEWQSAMIASSVIEALSLPTTNGVFRLAVAMTNGVTVWEFLRMQGSTIEASVLYDSSCEPVRPLSAKECDFPIPGHDGTAVATLHLSHKDALPGVIVAEVEVASPSSAPPGGRSVRRFVRLMEKATGNE